jgi:hypothetical protein
MGRKEEEKVAQAIAAKGITVKEGTVATRVARPVIDRLISATGVVLAVALLALGGAAVYGGNFALENVRDRLEPQNIEIGALAEMTPEEKAIVGDYAGEKVDTGTEAEAYSRYIGLHVSEIGGGKTYSELGGPLFALEAQIEEATAAGEDTTAMEAELAGLRGQRDTVFKGETLRAILLNAYGWWTVGQITMWAGFGALIAGLLLAAFAFLGFRHARKEEAAA